MTKPIRFQLMECVARRCVNISSWIYRDMMIRRYERDTSALSSIPRDPEVSEETVKVKMSAIFALRAPVYNSSAVVLIYRQFDELTRENARRYSGRGK